MRSWEKVIPEGDRALLRKAGFGAKQSFGVKPALIIIDVTRSFIGSIRQSVQESVAEYQTSCGEAGWAAVEAIKTLLEACRARQIPVIFTTGDPVMRQFLPGATKISTHLTATVDFRGEEIPDDLETLPSDLILRKAKASAFFGTPLAAYLEYLGVDTLLITGTTTSGCVRATVVDAFSHGFHCFVVEECTFDRFELSHLVNLFDMNAKYADVIAMDEALQHVNKI